LVDEGHECGIHHGFGDGCDAEARRERAITEAVLVAKVFLFDMERPGSGLGLGGGIFEKSFSLLAIAVLESVDDGNEEHSAGHRGHGIETRSRCPVAMSG